MNEPCLLTWRIKGLVIILIIYVDDIILAGNCLMKLEEVKRHFSMVFKIKDLGEPVNYLGMKINRDREAHIIRLNQTEYIDKVLKRFKMLESKPKDTPMVTRQAKKKRLEASKDNSSTRRTKAPYRAAIGSLLYLAGATRPDLAFAVNKHSRSQMNPTENYWENVSRILRYLKGTKHLCLTYRGKTNGMEAISDASFIDCEESRSTEGYIIKLYGDTVAWRSHKQTTVAKSTCEAEYIAMNDACQELISLDKAIRDMTGKTLYPINIRTNNKSAKDCIKMEGNHKLKSFDYRVIDEIKTEIRK